MKSNRRMLVLTLLVTGTVALGFAGSHLLRAEQITEPPLVPQTAPKLARESAPLDPQSSSQFDLSRNVIAGGGGVSQGGSLRIEGTIGQSALETQMSGGSFTLNGGFWQPASGSGSPTPTPTPTASATPTPTPPYGGPTIYVEQGTNLLAAVDSVTFVRGPFTLTEDHNFSSDHRTRIIFCTTSLGFTQPSQPSIATLSVEVGGFSVPVESVGPSSFAGVDASYVVVRLPDLPPGDWPLSIRLSGVFSTNSPTLSIRAGP